MINKTKILSIRLGIWDKKQKLKSRSQKPKKYISQKLFSLACFQLTPSTSKKFYLSKLISTGLATFNLRFFILRALPLSKFYLAEGFCTPRISQDAIPGHPVPINKKKLSCVNLGSWLLVTQFCVLVLAYGHMLVEKMVVVDILSTIIL